MRGVLFLIVLETCQAQPELSPELALIIRIKLKVAENLNRLPNYTCEQSIERSQRVMPARKFEMLDTVRLEVALVEHKELYGWPGAHRIDESELSNLVGGTIGNGDFGLLARSIFLSDGSFFTPRGETEIEGRKAIRYDYRVPLLSSGYHIKVSPNAALVAYHGSFWVESGSLDLLKLDLTADDIPLYLGLKASTKILEYQRTLIGGSTFLLPSSAELLMVDLNGTEHRNRTRFHGCRQYAGESVLSFAEPPPDTPSASLQEVADIKLPREFSTGIALNTPIDSSTSAVGDPVEAKLVSNLKDHGKIIAPKGAMLRGRLTRLQRESNSYTFAIGFDSMEFPGSRAGLSGRENEVTIENHSRAPCLTSAYSSCNPVQSPLQSPPGPLRIQGNHLKLWRGFQMQLRSVLKDGVLLKSEKP